MPKVRSLADRFNEKVDRSGGPDACWPWTGSRNDRNYGQIGRGSDVLKTHRVAYELVNGPIPAAVGHHGTMLVLHRCDNPPCCNPAHLRLGTPKANTDDMIAKSRGHWQPSRPLHPLRIATPGKARQTRALSV